MLKEIRIKNLALVEKLQISFDSSLAVFTGETGAGKSIILQAIDLLSGKRASTSLIRNGHDQARVEASFELSGRSELVEIIGDMGVETDGELLICRVLSRKGKSRYYINGGLSTAKVASQISAYLLSVASQHDQQLLLLPRHHLDFLDLSGDLWGERARFGKLYEKWQELKKQCELLQQHERDKEQRRDFLTFQLQEIKGANLLLKEDLTLEIEKKRIKSADELKRRGAYCYSLLGETAGEALALARKELEKMVSLDSGLEKISIAVTEQSFLIEEIIIELHGYLDEVPSNNQRLDEVTSRIDLLQRLKRKYGESLADVLEYAARIEKELAGLESMDKQLIDIKGRLQECEVEVFGLAANLSEARRKIAAKLTVNIQAELSSLCFEQVEFATVFSDEDHADAVGLTRLGWDRPEFLFSANPGEPLKPLNKIASGGELSRMMLALKCILSRKDMVETVIFDEVDAGVGGKAAEAVAKKIKELSLHHQVMCITHLPQIAACAEEHLLVEKGVAGGRTRTTIKKLSSRGRVAELARMLDGETVSEESLAFAVQLIERHG